MRMITIEAESDEELYEVLKERLVLLGEELAARRQAARAELVAQRRSLRAAHVTAMAEQRRREKWISVRDRFRNGAFFRGRPMLAVQSLVREYHANHPDDFWWENLEQHTGVSVRWTKEVIWQNIRSISQKKYEAIQQFLIDNEVNTFFSRSLLALPWEPHHHWRGHLS